jgi:hypothetical protein
VIGDTRVLFGAFVKNLRISYMYAK